ncbi:hypothetical protein KC19_2G137300 [Ceratodon purpureus]|uniref:Uncharacterized protein n=1 Tax=Ceratodon purpureus TaxID=3225 RepID=A0A8T0IV94_CERPU|nr:hypothetical protein KC19_2G137300 [Ceratodon purpureus]
MAAMATIMKPLAGAIPVANGGLLPTRTAAGNCKQSWVNSSRRGQVRFVVRAESEESVVSQTPTSPIESGTKETGSGVGQSPPSFFESGTKETGSVVSQTPTSPIESGTKETGSGVGQSSPSFFESGTKETGSVVSQTPTSPIETGSSATELRKPSSLQNGGSTDEPEATTVGQTPLSPIEPAKEEPASKTRKPSPLQKGGTLDGDEAAGKDPAVTTVGQKSPSVSNGAGKFDDPRWRAGTWDITKFTRNGKIDWDAVIDAEVVRRKWLEENPEASNNSEPVVFDTATVPWWAWVKRFHLPEAELLNGRAAMVGYGVGYIVDSFTGSGLVDQQSSFLGKLLLFITVLGVLLVRKNSDIQNLRTIAKESTFYDKQWQASWKEDDDSDDKQNPTSS